MCMPVPDNDNKNTINYVYNKYLWRKREGERENV